MCPPSSRIQTSDLWTSVLRSTTVHRSTNWAIEGVSYAVSCRDWYAGSTHAHAIVRKPHLSTISVQNFPQSLEARVMRSVVCYPVLPSGRLMSKLRRHKVKVPFVSLSLSLPQSLAFYWHSGSCNWGRKQSNLHHFSSSILPISDVSATETVEAQDH